MLDTVTLTVPTMAAIWLGEHLDRLLRDGARDDATDIALKRTLTAIGAAMLRKASGQPDLRDTVTTLLGSFEDGGGNSPEYVDCLAVLRGMIPTDNRHLPEAK